MENAVAWTVIGVGVVLSGLILVTTQRMRADMKALEDRLNKRLDERLGRLEQEQVGMSERLGRLEKELMGISERLGRLEEGQAGMSERLGRLEAELARMAERLGRQEQEQARLNGVLETLPERLGRLEQEQARLNGVLETLRAGFSYRVDAGEGERVAEASESYESQE